MSRNLYTATSTGQAITGAGNFALFANGASVISRILEIRVWQSNIIVLEQAPIMLERGTTGGSGGTDVGADKMDTNSPNAGATVSDSATAITDVATIDWSKPLGWNMVQEAVWLPTPETHLILKPSDGLGISLLATPDGSTTIGWSIDWTEEGT